MFAIPVYSPPRGGLVTIALFRFAGYLLEARHDVVTSLHR